MSVIVTDAGFTADDHEGEILPLGELAAAGKLPQMVVSLGSAGSAKLEQCGLYQASSVSWRDMDASPIGFQPGVVPFLDLPAELPLGPLIPGIPRATLSTGADIVFVTDDNQRASRMREGEFDGTAALLEGVDAVEPDHPADPVDEQHLHRDAVGEGPQDPDDLGQAAPSCWRAWSPSACRLSACHRTGPAVSEHLPRRGSRPSPHPCP